jgi:transcription elongation factor GreA-like protein/transcription elongation GreA/GreB family factor
MHGIQSAKDAVGRRDFEKLDDIWPELIIDKQTNLKDLFEITTALKRSEESERALFLLELLASHCESEAEHHKTIAVYKHILQYRREDDIIRKKLVALYKVAYHESSHINEYIDISGISGSEPLFKSIERLEEFLHYDVGKCFYFERYGIGEVIDTIPSRREIVINFEKKERHFLTLAVAKGILLSISKEHFLYKKYKDVNELQNMAQSQPVEIVKFILKSFHEPLTASQIKSHTEGIVDKSALNKWWEKTKRSLEKDATIQISGKTAKTYAYIESGVDREQEAIAAFEKARPTEKYLLAHEYAKKMPTVFSHIEPHVATLGNSIYEREPALALDILFLLDDAQSKLQLSYTIEHILERTTLHDILTKMNNFAHQQKLLQIIKEKNPSTWIPIFESLIVSVDDFKVLDEISKHLQNTSAKVNEVYYSIFSMPKQHPHQYQWLLRKIQKGNFTEYLSARFLSKFIDSLEYVKGIRSTVMKILSLKDFDKMIKDAHEDDIQHIIESINRNSILTDSEKKDYLRIIEHHFSRFFSREIDIIYSTKQALIKKRAELHHMYTVEIPENKKEISRAREFGDLSENFEYKAAKERQDQLYQKLKTLDAALKKTVIIDPQKIDTACVSIGTKVTLKNRKNDEAISYTILGRWDTNLDKNIISNEAPIALFLLGKVCGDTVILNDVEYEIVRVEKGI